MIRIYSAVRRTPTRSIRRSVHLQQSLSMDISNDAADSEQESGESTMSARHFRRSRDEAVALNNRLRDVAKMALLYTIPYYITWTFPSNLMLMNLYWGVYSTGRWTRKPRKPTSASIERVYYSVAMPVQGFINWCVFMLTLVTRYLEAHPISTCRCFPFCHGPLWCHSKVSSNEDVNPPTSGEAADRQLDDTNCCENDEVGDDNDHV